MATQRSLSLAGRSYVLCVFALGLVAITHSLYDLVTEPIGYQWLVLAVLTLVSGSATVKLSSIPSTVSVSETFVFTSVLLFGVPAGTLTVALDSLVISFWVFRRRPHALRLMFNMAAPALSMWIGATVFFATSGAKPLSQEPSQISELALPLLLFAVVYFLLNSAMTAVAIAFENRVNPVALWREHYVWVSLNYFGGASLAALLVVYTREIDFTYLAIIVPLLLILYLTFKTSMARVEDANLHLAQMNTLYLSTIETLAMAVDAKDQITHGHIRRVQSYAAGLARALGLRTENDLRAVEAAALLHDMGKLAIPEYILNKPGKLTPAEFEKMKQHARIGADILSEIDFPYPVVPIVRHHHENWDGSGYPDGLVGDEIPIGARVLSVVDCFDALTSDRPYRPRLPDDEALAILKDRSGVMYDPRVVDTFSRIYRTIAPSQREFQSKHELGRLLRQSPSGAPMSTQRTTFDDIASSSGEMLTFYDLAHSLTAKVTLSDAGDIIAKHLRRLLPASTCVYFMYEPETDDLVAKHASGDYAAQVSGLRIGIGERLSGWVAANRQTILNSDPILDLGDIARSLNPRPRSALCTPLLVEGKLVGVLSLYSTSREVFTSDHGRVVEMVGRQVSQPLRDASRFDVVRQTSSKDQITGLPNIDQLRSLFGASVHAESYDGSGLSLVVVDVVVLDQSGREVGGGAGADILPLVAESIGKSLRGADIVFRSEGDEFVLLLEQTDHQTSQRIAKRILEAASRITTDRHGITTFVRVGPATAPQDGRTLDDVLAVAKSRLVGPAAPAPRPVGLVAGQSVH